MTITLGSRSTVLLAGDSTTDGHRAATGCSHPLLVAGERGFPHPERPMTCVNGADPEYLVMDPEACWHSDVLDRHPEVVSIPVGGDGRGCQTFHPSGHAISVRDDCQWLHTPLAASEAPTIRTDSSARTGAEHWSTDAVHPTPAGHVAPAREWLGVVE